MFVNLVQDYLKSLDYDVCKVGFRLSGVWG